jgi:hypothetical protein
MSGTGQNIELLALNLKSIIGMATNSFQILKIHSSNSTSLMISIPKWPIKSSIISSLSSARLM